MVRPTTASDKALIREMGMNDLVELLKTLTDPKLIALAEDQIRQLKGIPKEDLGKS